MSSLVKPEAYNPDTYNSVAELGFFRVTSMLAIEIKELKIIMYSG